MFRLIALLAFVAVLGGCSTVPQGTLVMYNVKDRTTVMQLKAHGGFDDLVKLGIERPEDIDDRTVVYLSPYRDIFGGGSYQNAYVPAPLRHSVDIGDIVEVSTGGPDATGKKHWATITRVIRKYNDEGPNPCRWTGSQLLSQTVECDYFEKDGWKKITAGGIWAKLPDTSGETNKKK